MLRDLKLVLLAAVALTPIAAKAATLNDITNIVVIYAENRSFDNLYGNFPGANGLAQGAALAKQMDRDGTPLKELPATWGGVTAAGVTPPVTQMQSEHLANAPFAIDGKDMFNLSLNVVHRDLWHRFYQEQMQIDGGKNDKFAAWADSGGLVMGYYEGAPKLPLWGVAQKYVLADNFFQGGFGGSFLNHFALICACAPKYPNAATSPAKPTISVVAPDGITLVSAPDSPKSAMDGPPKFVSDGNITPDGYAVNTMQPPYQPSANKPAAGGDPRLADPMLPTTLPPQTDMTIGDLLSQKGVTWAWYGGAWQATLDGKNATPAPNFQFHHQPFNYFVNYAPGTPARAEHLKDGGMDGSEFIKAIDAGTLPAVAFYKPQGNLNEHGGYTDVSSGDQHIADVVAHLEKSPQFAHMVVLITYDENGGFYDHVSPPKADRWGPGNRIPAIIVSPFAKKGTVDHTQYDTTSVLRLITRRFQLPVLAGITARDTALVANGKPAMGDLTGALDLTP